MWQSSIRLTALLVVAAVLLSPLVLLGGTIAIESLRGDRMRQRAEETAITLATRLGDGSTVLTADEVRALAAPLLRRWKQRVRLIGPDDRVASLGDELGQDTLFSTLGEKLTGSATTKQWRTSTLAAAEAELAPLPARPEVVDARRTGQLAAACATLSAANLYFCGVAATADTPIGRVVVHVEGSSLRAMDALYGSRQQLLRLTGLGWGLGLLLALLLGRRIVQPIESLRTEVMRRAGAALPQADLHVDRRDEIGDLARAFNSLLAALQERSRANEAFLADLAHELKNPIAAIRAAAERLRDGTPLDAEGSRLLGQVLHRSSLTLDANVSQFLELARAEAGLPHEDRVAVELGAELTGLVAALRADPRYVPVTFECAVGPPTHVLGVAHRLQSAFRNLLENAASFSGPGGVVKVALARVGSVVQVAVTDTGPGIATADLGRVFERFFTTRGDGKGTGLGLALTRAIIEAHGGTVRAESSAGGARLTVTLPFIPDSQG